MTKIENDCCDCAAPAYPCMGSACSLRHSPHFYCDKCHDDVDELYILENGEYCENCILDMIPKKSIENYDGDD